MDILVCLLCILFTILILNHICNYIKPSIIEGATTYEEYSDDPLVLAQKNAGNIDYLKTKFAEIDALTKQVTDLNETVETNTSTITSIVDAQTEQTEQLNDAQDSITDE
jgi:hypothetical protein